jgi:hypothetical protein
MYSGDGRAKRPRGRPPLDRGDPSVKVSLSLPSQDYARICADASRARVSVPEALRRALVAGRPEWFTKKN